MAAPAEFELHGVVHLIRPWGDPARDLDRLRDGIASAPVEVLFRHAVQHQVRHPGADELPPDDFSAWVGGVVQDPETAERLSFEVQSGAGSPEGLRAALLSVLDAIPPKRRAERDAPEGSAFVFMTATSLSFPMDPPVRDADELVESLIATDAGVWFLHLIEQPFFLDGRSPLLEWLESSGQERLARWLEEAARAALPIERARARMYRRWRQHRIGRRLAETVRLPDEARREAGRQAVARLVRRRPGSRDGT